MGLSLFRHSFAPVNPIKGSQLELLDDVKLLPRCIRAHTRQPVSRVELRRLEHAEGACVGLAKLIGSRSLCEGEIIMGKSEHAGCMYGYVHT